MSRPRDSQKKKVHDACDAVFSNVSEKLTVADCQDFVTDLWEREIHIDRDWPIVTDGRGRRSLGYSPVSDDLAMPPYFRSRHWLCFGMAWAAVPRDAAWHGWQFCSILLDLVEKGINPDEARYLRLEFDVRKVRYRKPRTRRPMTDAERKAASQRLAVARQRKMAADLEAAGWDLGRLAR